MNVVHPPLPRFAGRCCLLLALLLPTARAAEPVYVFSTLAGSAGAAGNANGNGSAARFDLPQGVATDAAGNVYVADHNNSVIRQVTPAGVVTTFAGQAGATGTADGPAATARFNHPRGVAVDSAGNVYVTDMWNHTLRKITPAGVVTTLAGQAGFRGSADGTGPAARFNAPRSAAVDAAGNVYVADTDNCTIRKVTATGVVTTLAGSPLLKGSENGTGSAARFNYPAALAVDATGNVFVADEQNHAIRKITAAGLVTTHAGSLGVAGSADGTTATARLSYPAGIAINSADDLFVAEGSSALRKISADGTVTTIGGRPWQAGTADGTGTNAQFNSPQSIAVDSSGQLSIADGNNHTIRRGVLTVVPTIVTQPLGRVVPVGTPATFGVTTDSSTPTVYRWQRLANDSAWWTVQAGNWSIDEGLDGRRAWQNLSDDAAYGGTQTATLTVKNPTLAMAGDQFRCRVGVTDLATDGVALSVIAAAPPAPAVAPLIKTTWNNYQWPINAYFPKAASGGMAELDYRVGNACGPSSIARLLRFWEFPQKGIGRLSHVAGDGVVWSADFGATTYRYDQMPYDVPVTAPESLYAATATLCFHAAVAMEDKYGSGMNVLWLRRMFVNYFGYAPAAYEANRWQHSRAEWIQLLKSELDRGRPVLVMARTVTSPAPWQPGNFDGHWYVIDGYNSEDKFHYAYGYAIPYPAYCDVDDIGNYNSYHRVLIGLEPPLASTPTFTSQPQNQTVAAGGNTTLTVAATLPGSSTPTIQWRQNGVDLAGATSPALTLNNVQPANTGLYTAVAASGSSTTASGPAIVGVTTTDKVTGAGEIVGEDIPHSNGNIFDQVLLNGAAESITADHAKNQITRTSFVDLDKDIVQVEFSGPGTLSLVLADASGPAAPEYYNQSVLYMKGHVGIVITGATESTNVSVFSVGRKTALNQALFKDSVTYDGIADLAFIAISSTNGKFGGVRTANANYFAAKGFTGLYAPGVAFTGPVFLGDITAFDDATPVIRLGAAQADTRITGGDLLQDNGRAVQVSGLTRLQFTDGGDSHGHPLPAQPNRAVLHQDGQDVTAQIVVNPSP